MDEFKRQRLKPRRGDWCLVHVGSRHNYAPTYGTSGGLCGCSSRTPPPRKHQDRIVKRAVQRQAEREINEAILALVRTATR